MFEVIPTAYKIRWNLRGSSGSQQDCGPETSEWTAFREWGIPRKLQRSETFNTIPGNPSAPGVPANHGLAGENGREGESGEKGVVGETAPGDCGYNDRSGLSWLRRQPVFPRVPSCQVPAAVPPERLPEPTLAAEAVA
eukprot:gene14962-biopygen12207